MMPALTGSAEVEPPHAPRQAHLFATTAASGQERPVDHHRHIAHNT